MPLTVVNCPVCHIQVQWNDKSLFKPFCSERCKLIDLGDWASEKHVIPVKNSIDPDMLDDIGFEEEDFFKQ
ncbi:DNA gyrase inhibitor YacG [Shewanella sp. A14]